MKMPKQPPFKFEHVLLIAFAVAMLTVIITAPFYWHK